MIPRKYQLSRLMINAETMSNEEAAFKRILVIDDNAAIHDDFRKILGARERNDKLDDLAAALFDEPETSVNSDFYEIDSALQGQEGFAKLQAAVDAGRPYGVAFVDVRMPPGWDGIETTEKLWSIDPNLQVVLCTAYSDYSWAEMTERLGGTDRLLLLKKPFENMEVLQLASTLSQKRQLAQLADLRNRDLLELVEHRTAELRLLAETDPLTRMANRSVFLESLTQCIAQRGAAVSQYNAVIFLDLDNFKLINDSLGHTAGDQLLVKVAERLQTCSNEEGQLLIAPPSLAARMGGDEFAVMLRNVDSEEEISYVAQRLLESIREPARIAGRVVRPSASVGIALISDQTLTAEDVLMQSDTAMYDAKATGKNTVSLFDVAMHQNAMRRLSLEADIQNALLRHDFQLYCQPIFHLSDMRVRGYEALIRWVDENGQVRSPADFIPVAEETGQIISIGLWVIDKAAELVARSGLSHSRADMSIRLGVNVARQQLLDPNFVHLVKEILSRHNVPGNCFCFEITESTFVKDTNCVIDVLTQLRAMGIQIHLDDFGTGYSSLSCLHRYPIDVIKVDRSFVSGRAANSEAIVEALLVMANALGMQIIAEGIETQEQLDMLRRLKCPFGQGYLLGRPQLITQLPIAGADQKREDVLLQATN